MKSWYILYTKPRSEKKLNQELFELKIETYLPLISEKKKWSDRIKTILSPLFSSYLFVNIDYQNESRVVLKRNNALQFIHFEGKPAILKDEEIETIKLFLTEYPDKLKVEELEKISVGNEIEIKSGPFIGKKGIIEKIKNKTFLVLKLKSINKSLSIEVNLNELISSI